MKKKLITTVSSLLVLCTPTLAFANTNKAGVDVQDEAMVTQSGKVLSVEQLQQQASKVNAQAKQEVEKSESGTQQGLTNEKVSLPDQVKVYDPISKTSKSYTTKTLFTASQVPGVIGKDDRTRVTNTKTFPYSATGMIIAQFGRDTFTCSGAYIDKNTVLTAAHCLYHPETNQYAKNIRFIPAATADSRGNLVAPYGIAKGIDFSFAKGWKKANLNYDYGVITTDKSLGKKSGHFGLRPANTLKGQTVTAVGYPAVKKPFTMWKGSGKVISETSRIMKYYIDTTAGQSGGPVFQYSKKYGYYALGVISHGIPDEYNAGTKLAPKAYDAVKNWAAKDQ
ncbi:trypsin-like serine peptidase [Thermoflavimicrobium dichotomicum]|uniref:Serine protease n=1 Tax=Thermoflavimicrobium dichotomicum TaxID=46223 RepID=A0A1I3LG06_9BACL|nr:trypsin-like serine protease [Thermoflavimicrobium dichotomicum]SFI83641.1 V8-like Glu-specific endopeptidase [Thermoflavimicrobium dichotomicum]